MSARTKAPAQRLPAWTPLERRPGVSSPVLGSVPVESTGFDEIWENSRYTVLVRYVPNPLAGHFPNCLRPMRHLSIRNADRSARHDWRDFQRIKNEICGPEWEGVEIYPADSRLVDGANQYHLWCFPPPFRLPFGFDERMVLGPDETPVPGAVQRPFDQEAP